MIDFSKFPHPTMRDEQKHVLEKINANIDKYKYIVLEGGTGLGKTSIAQTICDSYLNGGFILTATKQLQDQYVRDSKNMISNIKGRSNYPCVKAKKRLMCDFGPCLTQPKILKECKLNKTCHYYLARDRAVSSKMTVTSYQYFFGALNYKDIWKPRDVLIIDECHLLEQQITHWAEFSLSPKYLSDKFDIYDNGDLKTIVELSIPPDQEDYESNASWIKTIFDLLDCKRDILLKKIGIQNSKYDFTEDDLIEIRLKNKEYFEIDRICRNIDIFLSNKNSNDWLIQPDKDGLKISPLHIGNLFMKYLDYWGIEKIIFMSATILDISGFCRSLNLPKDKTAVMRVESNFDPKNSPIYYTPAGPMQYNKLSNTIPRIIKMVENVLQNHPNENGIIHTTNYNIATAIADGISDPSRLIVKQRDYETNEMLYNQHLISNKPTVLVSPSLTTGIDLKDELSRFQIIVKLPWMSLKDKKVEKKNAIDGDWYVVEMFRTLIQSCGRSTRTKDDWSTTYIFDSSFPYWIDKYKKWFPKKFIERIIYKKVDQ